MSSHYKDEYPDTLTATQVSAYLRDHPDFFIDQTELLLDLRLPHESGQAVSLVERQVSVLRERSQSLRQRLHHLMDNAKDNDKLFEKTKRLTLNLLEARSLDDVHIAVDESLRGDFQADFCALVLFGTHTQFHNQGIRTTALEEAQSHINGLLQSTKPLCGVFRPEELTYLFPEQADAIASAAIVPLSFGNPIGVLAIGSRNPEHFKSGMGTLFLSYIAEVLDRTLPRYLPQAIKSA